MGIIGAGGLILPNLAMTNANTDLTNNTRPKVLFFDVNETLLDLTVMKKQVSAALGGREDLMPLWFTTMLQYSLVVSAGGQYEHFGYVGAAALQMVAANNGITISEAEARETIGKSVLCLHILR